MPSLFESMHQSMVAPTMAHLFGVSVRLCRGALISTAFTARRQDRVREVMGDSDEVLLDTIVRTYMLPVASVVLDGVVTEPMRGDLLIDGDDLFEILPRNGSGAAVLANGDADWLVHVKRRKGN